jgi:hypothetical protein
MIEQCGRLLEIFGKNDGSLPDIEFDNLSGEEVIFGYEFVKKSAERISSEKPYYWSTSQSAEIPILLQDNPSCYVVSGEAEPFHICFDGILSQSGKNIPELGLFVFPDCLAVDYRMGSYWGIDAIEGLFEFFLIMTKDFKNVKLSHKNNLFDGDGSIFKTAWAIYTNA